MDAPHPYLRSPSVHVHDLEDETASLTLSEEDETVSALGSLDDLADEYVDDGKGGMVWHAQIVADDFSDPKHCDAAGNLKARRPVPQIRASDFFGQLERRGGRWVYVGPPLNGWPALVDLEVRAITLKVRRVMGAKIKRFWDAARGEEGPPSFPTPKRGKLRSVRATLRGPAWTARGWSPVAPGFAFWVAPSGVHVGADAVAAAPDAAATCAHLFAHRYAKAKESAKDLLTYHAAMLVEFDDGTALLCELAWLNGLGGYGGRSNWFPAARPGGATDLYGRMPDAMKAPWDASRCEVRLADMPFATWAQLEGYLQTHAGRGPGDRFLDPKVQHSGPVRLVTHRV